MHQTRPIHPSFCHPPLHGQTSISLILGCALLIAGCAESSQVSAKAIYRTGGKGDLAWNDASSLGLYYARNLLGINIEEASPMTTDEATSIFHKWLADPQETSEQLVITLSAEYSDMVETEDCKFNGRKILHFEGPGSECDNVRTIHYQSFEPAFLAGVAAMALSQTGEAGAIGGARNEPVQEYIAGFQAGVEWAGGTLSQVRYLSAHSDGFNNPQEGRDRAMRMYEVGIDVIFPAAGATSLGVIEAARTVPGLWVIGVDTDQSAEGLREVLGSVVKRVDLTLQEELERFLAGDFKAGNVSAGMADGHTNFIVNPHFEDWVRPDLTRAQQAAADAAKAYYGTQP